MKNSLKNLFMSDILIGFVVAATFAAAAPRDAFAQLATAVDNTRTTIFQLIMAVLGYGCYGTATFFGIQDVMGAKGHADHLLKNPLGLL